MAGVRLVGADGGVRTLKNLPDAIINARTMAGVGTLIVRSVRRDIRAQRSPNGKAYPKTTRFGRPAKRLLDTSLLINSITFEVQGKSGLVVGTNRIQAPTQHFGDDRSPKGKKFFAIPMTRQIARAYIAGRSLREQYPDAFVFESKKGGLFLARRRAGVDGKQGGVELLFRLQRRVRIEGTHFLGLSATGIGDVMDYLVVIAERHVAKRRTR